MNVLVIGGGGREHTIVWKLEQSPRVDKIYCIPGNAGISQLAECVDISVDDLDRLGDFAEDHQIDLTVVGPEIPLVLGITDLFQKRGLKIFGPDKKGAQIEGSKIFSKEFMSRHNIPTAPFAVFENRHEAREFIAERNMFPVVIKADGLAAGKGVIICQNRNEANGTIDAMMMDRKFGDAGSKIIIEDFMTGIELSILAFADGRTVKAMISAKDYKKAGEGDSGPNTGGMGAISPNPVYSIDLQKKCEIEVFLPTLEGLRSEGIDYRGIIYFGLMLEEGKIRVLEYNARFGDPETQVVLPRMKNDLLELILASIDGNLDSVDMLWDDSPAATVVAASGGYPENHEKGKSISGLDQVDGALVFHAGTKIVDGKIVTSGGRVLAVTAIADNIEQALNKAYKELAKLSFDGCFYRPDIGI